MLKLFLDNHETQTLLKNELNRLLFLPPVFLCIGSDRVTGDSLGPLTGQMLKSFCKPAAVYGTLSEPVTALNLIATERLIRLKHPGNMIVAVDSAVGTPSDIGSLRIFSGGLKAGEACGKNLPPVGDISVTATVSSSGTRALSSVRLGLIYPIAQIIASALKDAADEFVIPFKRTISN